MVYSLLLLASITQVTGSTSLAYWPTPSKRVTSHFGADSQGTGRKHKGVDLGCSEGEPIVAAHAGTFTRVAWGPNYGNWAEICQGRTCTRYAHLSGYNGQPRVGHQFKSGQLLGYCGETGNARGTHLHFEIREAGVALDPLPILRSLNSPSSLYAVTSQKIRSYKQNPPRRHPTSSRPIPKPARRTLSRVQDSIEAWSEVLNEYE